MMEFNPNCQDCPRLSSNLASLRDSYKGYWNRPVPSLGNEDSQLYIVGLAPGLHGANASGRPFTGDHAGIILYETLYKYGFSNHPSSISGLDNFKLINTYITNAVKCFPPQNKPTTGEINLCNKYLKYELKVRIHHKIIISLGTISHRAVLSALELRPKDFMFAHGATHKIESNITMIDSYHCSRYNTQTKRLTQKMFEDIFKQARMLINNIKK
jgi:uracil-DNA glycosylase